MRISKQNARVGKNLEGRMPIVVRRVSMKIGDKEFGARFAWGPAEVVPLALGRLDMFNKFNVPSRMGRKK